MTYTAILRMHEKLQTIVFDGKNGECGNVCLENGEHAERARQE